MVIAGSPGPISPRILPDPRQLPKKAAVGCGKAHRRHGGGSSGRATGLRFAGRSILVAAQLSGEAGIATFNEMFDGDRVRPAYERLLEWVKATSPETLAQKKHEAEALFRRIGITFAVYGEGGDTERLIPFDMMPRVFTGRVAAARARGQAAGAGAQRLLWTSTIAPRSCGRGDPGRARVPERGLEAAVVGIDPPAGVYSHIVGIDLVRTGPTTSSCSRTTAVRPRASPTCWRTARS